MNMIVDVIDVINVINVINVIVGRMSRAQLLAC
jgi:hypothetical protein